MTLPTFDLTEALTAVRGATEQLNADERHSAALSAMGKAIGDRQDDILEANTLDLEISRDMAMPDMVVDWLKLTPERVQTAVSIFQRLANLDSADMVGEGDHGSGVSRPVGVVGFIYEAFPDLGAIAAALCIRTGNALVLRGGAEASRTNQIITQILQTTLSEVGLPAALVCSIESNEIPRLELAQHPDLDLIIAHGRPSLVEQVVQSASIPVLPSRMGNCYLYWSASASLDMVHSMIVESHSGTPDAVSRIEKVLVHESHSDNTLTRLWNRLQEDDFVLKAETSLAAADTLEKAEPLDWGSAYLKRTVAFRSVKNNAQAVRWINHHSSGHADGIATADYAESRAFASGCRSASIYINTSPKFVRNAKRTHEIALGLSNRKGTTGGRISIGALRERQRIFYGNG